MGQVLVAFDRQSQLTASPKKVDVLKTMDGQTLSARPSGGRGNDGGLPCTSITAASAFAGALPFLPSRQFWGYRP
jgi:hypothetical protein